jgi:hypothetical protein
MHKTEEVGMTPGITVALIGLAGTIAASLIALTSAVFVFRRGQSLEKKATNKAILAEIHRLVKVVLPKHLQWSGRHDPKYPLIPFSTRVYDEQVKNIGSLDDDVVAPVVEFYGYLGYINSLQVLRDQYKKHSNEQEFEKQYDDSLSRLLRDFQTKFDHAFERYKLHVQ